MDKEESDVENQISVDMDCSSNRGSLQLDSQNGDHAEGERCVPVDLGEAVDDEFTPHIGIVFDTLKDAYDYYNEYARRTGFTVRKRRTNKKQGDSSKAALQTLCCSCEGYYTVVNTPTKRREDRRCGCLAKLEIRIDHEGKYVLTKFVAEHTHELDPPSVKTSNGGFSGSYYDPWKVPSHFDEAAAARFRVISKMIQEIIEKAMAAQSDELYEYLMSKFMKMTEQLAAHESSTELENSQNTGC